MKQKTYIDGSDSDHVGAVELQPHLLNGSPELAAALGALPVHLHDVQASGEDLGLTLGEGRDNTQQAVHPDAEMIHLKVGDVTAPR